MEKEKFDLAIEGTTLKDIQIINTDKKVLFVDRCHHYGTTYSSIKELEASKYISDFTLNVNKKNEKDFKLVFLIEALPFLLGKNDYSVNTFKLKAMGEEIEYVEIKDIFYLSETLLKIPISKNDILSMDLSDKDRFYLHKAIKEGDLSIIENFFSDKNSQIYQALVNLKILSGKDFNTFSKNWGSSIFVYPVHGISEISESVCFKNLFNGVVYVLNDTLEYSENKSDAEYKYDFNCDLGSLCSKEFIRQDLKVKKSFVRVIITKKQKFNGSFVLFINIENNNCIIDLENNQNNKSYDKFIKIMGLDSSSNACNEGLQLLYFIKQHSKIEDYEIEKFQIFKKDIFLDLSFTTKYDIDQFE